MRRIAAVTMSAVVVAAGVGLASPAEASSSARVTKSWVTFNGKAGSVFRTIKANGTYTRANGKVSARGWLHDTKANGWSPGVQFRTWGAGKWHYSKVYSVKYTSTGVPVDRRFDFNFGHFFSSSYNQHLQVREMAVKVTNKNTIKTGSWKKLY